MLSDAANVVIPPYVTIPVVIKGTVSIQERKNYNKLSESASTSDSGAAPTVTTILIVSLVLVGIIILIIIFFFYKYKHSPALGGRGIYHHM